MNFKDNGVNIKDNGLLCCPLQCGRTQRNQSSIFKGSSLLIVPGLLLGEAETRVWRYGNPGRSHPTGTWKKAMYEERDSQQYLLSESRGK